MQLYHGHKFRSHLFIAATKICTAILHANNLKNLSFISPFELSAKEIPMLANLIPQPDAIVTFSISFDYFNEFSRMRCDIYFHASNKVKTKVPNGMQSLREEEEVH